VPSSPSIRESLWAPETDDTYESSILWASPLVQAVAFPEGPDIFFNTSIFHPTASAYMSQEQSQLSMIVKSLSSKSPSITYSLSMTCSTLPTALSAPLCVEDTSQKLGHSLQGMFKYGIYGIFKDYYMNLSGQEATEKYKGAMSRTASLTSFSFSYFVFLVLFPSVTLGRLAQCLLSYLWTALAFSRDFHMTLYVSVPLCHRL